LRRKIVGWSILLLMIADFIFTYFDNKYGNPPSLVTTWFVDVDWHMTFLIVLWIVVLFASLILISHGGDTKNQEPDSKNNEHQSQG
jgi:hypothetical protein